MPELQPDLGGCRMHVVDDASPAGLLGVVPDARAARGDATISGCCRHLSEDQAGATQRARAVVREVNIARHAIDGRVQADGRHDNAVGDVNLAQAEGQEHRRTRRGACRNATGSNLALQQPRIDLGHELRITRLQVSVGDATTAGHHVEDELRQFLTDVLVDLLEPLHARLR